MWRPPGQLLFTATDRPITPARLRVAGPALVAVHRHRGLRTEAARVSSAVLRAGCAGSPAGRRLLARAARRIDGDRGTGRGMAAWPVRRPRSLGLMPRSGPGVPGVCGWRVGSRQANAKGGVAAGEVAGGDLNNSADGKAEHEHQRPCGPCLQRQALVVQAAVEERPTLLVGPDRNCPLRRPGRAIWSSAVIRRWCAQCRKLPDGPLKGMTLYPDVDISLGERGQAQPLRVDPGQERGPLRRCGGGLGRRCNW